MSKWQRLNGSIRTAFERDKRNFIEIIDTLPETNKIMIYSMLILSLKLEEKNEVISTLIDKLTKCKTSIYPQTLEFYDTEFMLSMIIDCSPNTFAKFYSEIFYSDINTIESNFESTFVGQGYYEQFVMIINDYYKLQKQLKYNLKKIKYEEINLKSLNKQMKYELVHYYSLAKYAIEDLVKRCLRKNNPERAIKLIELLHEDINKQDSLKLIDYYNSNMKLFSMNQEDDENTDICGTWRDPEFDRETPKLRQLLSRNRYEEAENLIFSASFDVDKYSRYSLVRKDYLSKGMVDETLSLNRKVHPNEFHCFGFYTICKEAVKKKIYAEKIYPYIEEYVMREINIFNLDLR